MDRQQSTIEGLMFQLTEDGNVLQAVFTPIETRQPLDVAQIKQALEAQNFHTLFLHEPVLVELSQKYEAATEAFTLNIGERRDATVAASVAPDNMSASVTISPPYGGRAVDRQQVLDALQAAGVISGILDTNIDAAIATGQAEAILAAQGREPVCGQDARLEKLVPDITERHPIEDEHGKVDLRNLGQFITVRTGEPLMRRVPPTPGEPGENVRGEAIPAKPGKDLHFAPGLKGTALATDDENLLVAAISGQPKLVPNGVTVEPILAVENVDITTGYLDFEGAINIAGDVKAGMRVTATSDVTIGGVVEAAEVHAGGNIVVKGGIFGNWTGEQTPQESGDTAPKSKVHVATSIHSDAQIFADGSVSALFVENGCVEAGSSISIEKHAIQSQLTAINQIIVGKDGAKKGHIIGGIVRATQLVQTAIVGTDTGVKTTIEVGVNPLLQSKLSGLCHQLQLKNKQMEDLEHVITFARENPGRIKPELLEKTERTCESLQLDIAALNQEKSALQVQMDVADSARIVVSQKTYGGVKVRIGDKVRQIENELGPGTFHLMDNEIHYS